MFDKIIKETIKQVDSVEKLLNESTPCYKGYLYYCEDCPYRDVKGKCVVEKIMETLQNEKNMIWYNFICFVYNFIGYRTHINRDRFHTKQTFCIYNIYYIYYNRIYRYMSYNMLQ